MTNSNYHFFSAVGLRLQRLKICLYMAGFLALFLGSTPVWSVTALTGPILTMDPNGVTPLAGVIQLSTDQPARITLKLSKGEDNRTIEFAEYKTEFSLPLLGLKPDSVYTIEITLTAQQNQQFVLTPALQAVTGPLPDDFPHMEVIVSEPDMMEPGYTILAKFYREGGNVTDPTYTIIVDHAGEVVWYSTLADVTNYQLANGNLLYRTGSDVIELDFLGNEIRRTTMNDPGIGLTHDLFPTINETFLSITVQQVKVDNFPTSVFDPNAPTITADVEDNPVVEFDQNGNLLNIWSQIDLLDTSRIGYQSLNFREVGYDWAHLNSVIHDPSDDSIIMSVRHQDAVVKFSRTTGDIKWILGNHSNWSSAFQPFLLTPLGEPFEWQFAQHAPMITPSGTLLMFDNGNFRASPFDGNAIVNPSENYSRAVEYEIDEEAMEVRQVWEYGGNIAEPLYAGHISDANWLENKGNVLITFGGTSYTGGVPNVDLGLGDVSTRVIEVTHETPAVKVFDLSLFEPTPGSRIQVYRSERIPDLYPLDSDGDGVPDYKDNCAQVPNGPLIPGDPFNSQLNTDGDSKGNACDFDDDNDGIADEYEIANQLDPLNNSDAALDKDGDGLTNVQEFQLGTLANNADTDSDDLDDGLEIAEGRDPLVNEGAVITIINSILNK